VLDDQWTVVTKEGTLSAQWEHMVLITEDGYEVLTLRVDEEQSLRYGAGFEKVVTATVE
jgi:methionyl aminopeptidase